MSLGQYFDIIDEKLSLSRVDNCYRTDSIRSRGRNIIEKKAESKNGQAGGRIKSALSGNSEENFEPIGVGSELMKTVCSNQDEAMRNLQNVINLLQLSAEQSERLGLSMSGEENREEQLGIKYRYDQRTGEEKIVIPSEWL